MEPPNIDKPRSLLDYFVNEFLNLSQQTRFPFKTRVNFSFAVTATTEVSESVSSTTPYNESSMIKLIGSQQDVAVDDSGKVAWIVIGVLIGVVAVASVVSILTLLQSKLGMEKKSRL